MNYQYDRIFHASNLQSLGLQEISASYVSDKYPGEIVKEKKSSMEIKI